MTQRASFIFMVVLFIWGCGDTNKDNTIATKTDSAKPTIEKNNEAKPLDTNTTTKKLDTLKDQKPAVLTFSQLYPILKKSLLKTVCETYTVKESKNRLEALSKENKGHFLSTWEWDFKTSPMTIKDLDKDGLMDYSIELFNEGGGCGGNIGESERWTMYGSKPNQFEWTHVIPYQSATGKWEKVGN